MRSRCVAILSSLLLFCVLTNCNDARLTQLTSGSSPVTDIPTVTTTSTPNAHDPTCAKAIPDAPSQTDYRGVVPGKTTAVQVQELWGKPTRIYSDQPQSSESWIYDTVLLEAEVKIQNNIVESMRRSVWDESNLLEQVVASYGCPDLIYRLDLTTEKQGWYGWTLFVYARYGVQFLFNEFPPTKTAVTEIEYFPATSPVTFLHTNSYLHKPTVAKQISWQDLPR